MRPFLRLLDQVFPLWILCFGPLSSNLFGTRIAMNDCVQDAAQIQNEVRLIMAIREPRGVINFRHPFLEQISCTSHAASSIFGAHSWNKSLALACRTSLMWIGGISSLKSGPSSAMPCLDRR